MRRRRVVTAALLATVVLLAPAGQTQSWPEDAFVDDDASVHETAINVIANLGITAGCNPPDNDEYCPSDSVSRGQMAAFLRRALDLPIVAGDYFVDDAGSVFENDINAIAAAGITTGCNPPDNDEYCPVGTVTRGQMAAFLKRAAGIPSTDDDFFTDDESSVFENDINAIAAAEITVGCNPPDNDRYCPINLVTRAQMATFLVRAFDLVALPPDPALDFVLAFNGVCDDDQTTCQEDIFFPAATTWPIDEGWFHVTPFGPGEQEAFESPGTVFRVWLDGQPIAMTAQPTETMGGEAIRRFTGTLPPLNPGTYSLVGEWWWDGEALYRTELTVTVP